jgi:hypothetical protein
VNRGARKEQHGSGKYGKSSLHRSHSPSPSRGVPPRFSGRHGPAQNASN